MWANVFVTDLAEGHSMLPTWMQTMSCRPMSKERDRRRTNAACSEIMTAGDEISLSLFVTTAQHPGYHRMSKDYS